MNNLESLKNYSEMFKEYKRVYDFFEDEESKKIYSSCVMYRMFENPEYFFDSICYILEKRNRKDVISKMKNGMLVLFGAGVAANDMLKMFAKRGIHVAYCVDNNEKKWGTKICGCAICSPEELLKEEEEPFVIITASCYKVNCEIKEQLLDYGMSETSIFSWFDVMGKMYIESDIVPIVKDDVFVDGGCFDGLTAIDIQEAIDGGIKKIYAYEPDLVNLDKCKENLKELDNVVLINAGVFSRCGEVYFNSNAGESSAISECGTDKILVSTIDKESPDATFIKMDIEGSELEALKGGAETIKRNKPKMAISIYHKPEDLLELPLYLKALVPEYKLYLRHYSMAYMECVLFAIVE